MATCRARDAGAGIRGRRGAGGRGAATRGGREPPAAATADGDALGAGRHAAPAATPTRGRKAHRAGRRVPAAALAEPPVPDARADLLAELGQAGGKRSRRSRRAPGGSAGARLGRTAEGHDRARARRSAGLRGPLHGRERAPARRRSAELGDHEPELRVAMESMLLAVARLRAGHGDVRFELLGRIRRARPAGSAWTRACTPIRAQRMRRRRTC
jgi:hypothetical protein